MRRTDGLVKILDFGIAKLVERQDSDPTQRSVHTELGVVMGTVDYMSPEQARGDTVDELGVLTIWEAIADQLLPGLSTIQTRARYFFFIPWIYKWKVLSDEH